MFASQLFLHAIEILIFTTSDRVGFVTSTLLAEGVVLEPPLLYQPADYPGHPRLIVQAPPPGAQPNAGWSSSAPGARPYVPIVYNGGSASGQLVQSKEQSEAERKKQVDSVYSSLRSGEDLVEVQPNAVITTPLFPHQKQALAFLIDREKERNFEYPNGVPAPPVKGKGKASKPEVAETPDVSYDEDTVSLWRPKKDSQGKIRSYLNIVTNQEQQRHPEICRGAILADDMGLGKTITTISLIAHTWNEGIAYGKSKPSSPNAVGVGSGQGKDDDDDDGFEMMNLPSAPAGKGKAKGAGKAKAQEKKNEAERVRRRHLEVRSRATLIVLPLTLVSSWVSADAHVCARSVR